MLLIFIQIYKYMVMLMPLSFLIWIYFLSQLLHLHVLTILPRIVINSLRHYAMELRFGELSHKDFIAITKPPTGLSRASVAWAILLAIIDRSVYALEDLGSSDVYDVRARSHSYLDSIWAISWLNHRRTTWTLVRVRW